MRKAIGIGIMAALVAGLGLTVPATVYANSTEQAGQAGSGNLIGQGKDGIYSIQVDGKELIKGDPVSKSAPIYYFSNTEPKQIMAMESFGGGSGQNLLPLRNIAPNETSCGSTVVKGKTYKPDGNSSFYVVWAKAGDFFKNMKMSYNGSEAEINLFWQKKFPNKSVAGSNPISDAGSTGEQLSG